MNRTTYGLDIAKNVMQLHWVDGETGEIGRKKLGRAKLGEFFAQRQPTRVAMEACGSAHHWARVLGGLGHRVELLPAQQVRAFVRSNKDDAADARAIWLAAQHSDIRRAPVKTVEQQAVMSLHRARSHWVSVRTATITLREVPGVGVLGATALAATLGDASGWRSGREFAASLGLVPSHSGTGGKTRVGHLSKRGDPYLRTLLIHGARAVITQAKVKPAWLEELLRRRPLNVAVVALANKMARTVWALVAHGRAYRSEWKSTPPSGCGAQAQTA